MNYMKQVAEMLGVEIEERFEVKGVAGYEDHEFYFDRNGLWREERCKFVDVDMLHMLILGECVVVKKPWKPKDGCFFYFVDVSGAIYKEIFDTRYYPDVILVRSGNCYQTREEVTPELVKLWKNWYVGGVNQTEVNE